MMDGRIALPLNPEEHLKKAEEEMSKNHAARYSDGKRIIVTKGDLNFVLDEISDALALLEESGYTAAMTSLEAAELRLKRYL